MGSSTDAPARRRSEPVSSTVTRSGSLCMPVVGSASVASVVPAGEWSIDATRSSVAFALKHMMLKTVKGSFHSLDGTLEIGADASRATGAIKAASIDTNEPVRDEHLRRSPDFFDVERYPEIGFNSTRIA